MSDYNAIIETFNGGRVVVFKDGAKMGDPYDYSIGFKLVDEHTIEIKGVYRNEHGQDSLPRAHQWRAMKKAFKEAGYKVIHERRTGANPGEHVAVK